MSRCGVSHCEAIGCPGHKPPTSVEKKRAAKIDGVLREVLENQGAIMRALKYMSLPSAVTAHLEERIETTRRLLEGKRSR